MKKGKKHCVASRLEFHTNLNQNVALLASPKKCRRELDTMLPGPELLFL